MDDAKVSRPLVSRRTTLRAAAVGASAVWIAPLVQVIAMDSASAASGSPPTVPHDNRNNEHRNKPFDPGPKNKH